MDFDVLIIELVLQAVRLPVNWLKPIWPLECWKKNQIYAKERPKPILELRMLVMMRFLVR